MLKDGMLLCNALRISPVLIESDSSLVVAAIRTERSDHWRFSYVLKEFLALFSSHYAIIHGSRQKHFFADRLADWAYSHRRRQEFYRVPDLPKTVRSTYLADKMDLWSYRA